MKRVKKVKINTHNSNEKVVALLREIQIYATKKHERIVEYLGATQDPESISIFMEYMEGVS